MSGGSREKDQADFDLERFISIFDEALTSKDPRVIETLRSLMMIVTLTRPEARVDYNRLDGPLRRLFDDVRQTHRRLGDIEETLRTERQIRDRERVGLEKEYAVYQAADDAINRRPDRALILAGKLGQQISSPLNTKISK